MSKKSWDMHYTRERSVLTYPDENLVRLIKKNLQDHPKNEGLTALDLGCGSGRHLKLLDDMGFENIIGLDSSLEALHICRDNYPFPLVQCNNMKLPLKSESADIAVAWGSLHYNTKDDLPEMTAEILRVMKKGGKLMATLRSEKDTYLKKGKHLGNNTWITDLSDITGSTVSFYSEDEIKKVFTKFKDLKYGLIERTIPGDINSRISHWIISAEK